MAAIYLSGSAPLRHLKVSGILCIPFNYISFFNNLLHPSQYSYLIMESSRYYVIWAINRATQLICIFSLTILLT